MERQNIVVEYAVPFLVEKWVQNGGSETPVGTRVKGVAIEAGVSRNKINYLPEELEKAAEGLVGKPIIKDHDARVDNIVGKVLTASYNKEAKQITFEGVVIDSSMEEKIVNKLIQSVSVGAGVDELVEEKIGEEVTQTAKGIHFDELSLVVVPGVRAASLSQALSEKYEKVIRVAEMKVREDEKDDEIARLKAENEELKKKLAGEEKKEACDKDHEDDKKEEKASGQIAEMAKQLEEMRKLVAEKVTARTPPSEVAPIQEKKHNYVYDNVLKEFFVKPDKQGNLQLAE